jgi:CxxC motif-containing protein (DUF1111 family)
MLLGTVCAAAVAVIGRAPFTDHRDPPAYRALSSAEAAAFDLGHAVFNTQWVVAGTPRAARRDGLGPLFNATSCDECHNEGAHGRGPVRDGPAPLALVIQLDSSATDQRSEASGDPIYGHAFNTRSLPVIKAEGAVKIHFQAMAGRYPDGNAWELRVPHYELAVLRGPIAATTIVRPRLAPALFGVGLLEAVSGHEIVGTTSAGPIGRFGWQSTTVSIRDQTTRAFAREMGITSTDVPKDDCTASESDCLAQPNGGVPEVSSELLDAVLAFQTWLAVPESPERDEDNALGASLFARVGCDACHRPRVGVKLEDADGHPVDAIIEPYSDLRLHDLGDGLADQDNSGRSVASRWRTAPLWGLGYRLHRESFPTFLHDGRARSSEEAILWHAGEGSDARRAFERLTVDQRRALLQFLAAL